jgi:hypothetical protein
MLYTTNKFRKEEDSSYWNSVNPDFSLKARSNPIVAFYVNLRANALLHVQLKTNFRLFAVFGAPLWKVGGGGDGVK